MPTDEERASFKRAELHRTHRCATCEAEAVAAALDALAAEVAGLDFMVPRGCDCHAGQMRRAQEPDEYRAAVLAAIEKARP